VWKLGVADDRESYRATLEKGKAGGCHVGPGSRTCGSESGLISDFEEGALPNGKFGSGWIDFHGQHSRRSIHRRR